MTKQEITKEILISAFYLGKYLIQKHKLKKKQKLEAAAAKRSPEYDEHVKNLWQKLEAIGFDFKMQRQIASEIKQIFQEKLEELKAK